MSDDIREAIVFQAEASRHLGSQLYGDLLFDLLDDYDSGGLIAELLVGASDRPIHDALVLRMLGAVHRVALRGDAPALAAHYPSCGGDGRRIEVGDFLAVVRTHLDDVRRSLGEQVQTNEVGRGVVLVALSHWMRRLGIDAFDLVEVGTSAGLNQNFDRLGVEPPDDWFDDARLSREPAKCIDRRGCDVNPLDVANPDDALRLQSFVWPDQLERLARLRSAIDVARRHPPVVEQSSADDFLHRVLARDRTRSQMVFHSIVWQYLGDDVQGRMRGVLHDVGTSNDTPLLWARMEPAGAVADVRVTVFSRHGIDEHRLAEVGYHGQEFRWLG